MEQFLQAAILHGPELVDKARQEWQDVPGSSLSFLTADPSQDQRANYFYQKLEENRCEDPDTNFLRLFGAKLDSDFKERVQSFVSSKADLLFTGKKAKQETGNVIDCNTIAQDRYGEVAPLEVFMGIPISVKTNQLWKIIKVGDIVIGKVTAIKTFGLFIQILSLEFSRRRDFIDSDLQAMCRTCDLGLEQNRREYQDPTDAFRVGDIVRGVIVNLDAEEGRIAFSMKTTDLSAEHQDLSLGILEDYDEKKLRYEDSEDKSYIECLTNHPGFNNPRSVDTLMNSLGIEAHSSLMRGLQRHDYPKEEYFDELRKKQSIKWSMSSTAKGVEHFKAGETTLALKYFDHALQIDPHNIEALVAKGALLANDGKYSMAIQLFREALAINHSHRNAMKYLIETLVEHGLQQEKTGHLHDAEKSFQDVLDVQPDHVTARDHIARVKMIIKRQKEKEKARKEESVQSKFSHVRRLIEEEELLHRRKRKKKKDRKKRKRRERKKSSRKSKYSDSSSSSSEQSDSDSDSPRPSKRRRSNDDNRHRRKSTSSYTSK